MQEGSGLKTQTHQNDGREANRMRIEQELSDPEQPLPMNNE